MSPKPYPVAGRTSQVFSVRLSHGESFIHTGPQNTNDQGGVSYR